MKEKPLVSVITVCFNSERFIRDTIESVLNQTYKNLEYIVIDGNSTDNTGSIISKYADKFEGRMRIFSSENSSVAECWNKGLELSKGDIIGFLNSDDFYVSDLAVKKIAGAFSAQDEVNACHFDILLVDRADIKKKKRLWISPSNGFFSDFKYGWAPAHPSFYASRETYNRYGSYDPDFDIAADFDLMCRFIKIRKIKLAYLPEVLINMRHGGMSNNHIFSVMKGNRECFLALKKNGIFPYFIFLKPLRKLFQIIRARIHTLQRNSS